MRDIKINLDPDVVKKYMVIPLVPFRVIGIDLGQRGSYSRTVELKASNRLPIGTSGKCIDLSIEDIRESATEAEFTIVDK